jgi:transposase
MLVLVATKPVDFRKGAEGLAALVREVMQTDPFTIPGVGPVAALALVVGLPELGACSGKAASLLTGLAPLACESGQRTGERHIKGGRATVRTGIYWATVTASRYNPQLPQTYKRLRAVGKKGKVALTAIMRKLVILANTIITEDRPWRPIHA